MFRLSTEPIDYTALTEAVRSPLAGAVVLFLGTVREVTGEEITVALTYDAYVPMAEKKLAEIEAEVRRRWTVTDVAMAHRLGRLEVSEVSVAVAVSAPHRVEAFEAARYAIDTLKEVVPIWKQDHTPTGASQWIHPTA
ncbi:MAG: molybdenum cofactor biosynthesis protein MoaE [Fimbriiglobus sp.]